MKPRIKYNGDAWECTQVNTIAASGATPNDAYVRWQAHNSLYRPVDKEFIDQLMVRLAASFSNLKDR